jgi:hypothetical protein
MLEMPHVPNSFLFITWGDHLEKPPWNVPGDIALVRLNETFFPGKRFAPSRPTVGINPIEIDPFEVNRGTARDVGQTAVAKYMARRRQPGCATPTGSAKRVRD